MFANLKRGGYAFLVLAGLVYGLLCIVTWPVRRVFGGAS